MTEETVTVARLDYSKPPPGYPWSDEQQVGWVPQSSGAVKKVEDLWAHYKVHNDPPGVVRCGPLALYVTYGPGLPRFLSRSEVWAWHDRRHALSRTLDDGVWCPECGSSEAHVEAIDDRTCTQPWCTECDVEMGGMFDDLWPRCLAWSDAEVVEVERWMRDSTAEMPVALRSLDDVEFLIGGPDDVGRVGAETHVDDGGGS